MSDSRHALIVAIDDYENPGLKRLVSPAEDAVALASTLGDPRIGDFDVQVARNDPSHILSMKIDDFFAERRPGDVLILHFSCHGLKSESGELFFAATNTVPGRLASTAVPSDFVWRCVSSCRARSIVLFLDCCYGGAFSRGMGIRAGEGVNVLEAFPSEKLGGGRGLAVITASSSMEYAFEGGRPSGEFSTPKPSVFTGALANGLTTGDADIDEDGQISLDELYNYVFDRVRRENPNQTPSRQFHLQGDLYVARSDRKKIKPQPLPEDLRAAVASPDMYTRRGALAELRSRMKSADLEVAAGAHKALVEMARKDIRSVADEASRALREVTPKPRPATLDFGLLKQGSSAPHRELCLPGPPLARSCAAHPGDDRIRVTKTSKGMDVSVDTSRIGRLSSTIVLKGSMGESTIPVHAEIVAESTPPPPPPPPPPSRPASVGGEKTPHRGEHRPPQAPPLPPPRSVPPPSVPPPSVAPPTGKLSAQGPARPPAPVVRINPPEVTRARVLAASAVLATVASVVCAGRAVVHAIEGARAVRQLMQTPGTGWADAVPEVMPVFSRMGPYALASLIVGIVALTFASTAQRALRAAEGSHPSRGMKTTGMLLTTGSAILSGLAIAVSVVLVIGYLYLDSVK